MSITPEDNEQQIHDVNRPEGSPPFKGEPVQPFRLVKYFSLTGFIVILIFTLVLSLVISQQAKSMLLKKSEDYAILMADNLNHQVFLQFTVLMYIRFKKIRLSDPVQVQYLDRVVRTTIHSFNVQTINIYDLEGNITYSTDKELIGTRKADYKPYQEALKGKSSTTLVVSPGEGLAGFERVRTLRTFYPFRGEEPYDDILGVFEIYSDLSDDYDTIAKFQYLSITISLIFMSLLFFILRKILMRAEDIIDRRNEERRRLEEKLHHSLRLANLGQMIAAVSHEIRNPLGIISSTGEILQGKIKKYEPQNRLADVIVEESRRLNGIVTEFLDFARPQVPEPELISLEDVLEKNLDFLSVSLEKEGVEVVRDYQGPETIQADPDLLYRAFLNIFINALQAMPDGGVLTVSTALVNGADGRKGQDVEVVISDTGTGIEPDLAENLFTPFFTTKNRGSGLGLAIVKNIIEEHNGVVAIGPGEDFGTRVVIHLPLTQE